MEANTQRILDSFFEMIAIHSPSFHEAPMAAYCEEQLTKLGFSVSYDDSTAQTGCDVGNLIADLPGTTEGHIVLSAHMDTVVPALGIEPVIEERAAADLGFAEEDPQTAHQVVCSAGDTILSADDKAGIASILEGLRLVLENDLPHPAITVLLTVAEEQSLIGSSALAEDTFEGGVPCFVLDADGRPGTIIMGAPYHYTLRAQITGHPAHAGVEPEIGVSAIQIAAAAVQAMPLGRLDECTTANIGRIEGGAAVNIVPATCTVEGECRSLYQERVESQRAAMTQVLEDAAQRFGGQVDIAWELDYPAVVHEEGDAIVQHLVNAAQAVGLAPRFARSGGGADANVLGTKGADAITLGIGMTNFHSTDEYILVEDLAAMATYVAAIIREYA